MRPDIAEEALPFSEKETQGNGWRFPKRKTSEQSEHCSDVAEKEGFEPSRQSPQPTPLAVEQKMAKYLQNNDICTLFVRHSILFTASSAAPLSGCIYRCVVENLVCRMTR